MSVSAILIEAKKLIEDPANWHKGDWSKKDDPSCMCGLGAIGTVLGYDMAEMMSPDFNGYNVHGSEPGMALKEVALIEGCDSFALFNDGKDTTHDMVLAMFDKAISRELEKGN